MTLVFLSPALPLQASTRSKFYLECSLNTQLLTLSAALTFDLLILMNIFKLWVNTLIKKLHYVPLPPISNK